MATTSARPHRHLFGGLLLFVLGLPLLLAAWSDDVETSELHTFHVEPVADGLDRPWGLAFLPDGRMLVTEKGGTLRTIGPDGTVSDPITGAPEVCDCGQGGFMDVQLHPRYQENRWLYFTYSDRKENDAGEEVGFTALMRAKLDGARLIDQETLFQAPAEVYSTRGQHFGSRIEFDDDGYVYFSIGDRGQHDDAQLLTVPNGKIHRLHDDGRIPEDNPFVDEPGAVASIWSYGHRNPQGLDRHPDTGELWNVEHGPRGGDELNHVRKGLNYGWPVITYGINYNGTPITDITEKEGMEQPQTYWVPSIAVSSLVFYDGDAFPNWKGHALVGSLRAQELHRLELDGTEVTHEEVILEPQQRIRDIVVGPDGYPYLAYDSGRIVRLVPEDA